MVIEFDNPKHEALVNDYDALCKKYNKKGIDYSKDILDTINILRSANVLFDVPRSFRPHPLKGGYKGCFAIDVDDVHRIIFKPINDGDSSFRIDNYKSIKKISILEIFINYH